MELNEREQNIVNLISSLADVASDEKSTQEAIDGIMSKIRNTTDEEMRDMMKRADEEEKAKTEVPASIADERTKLVKNMSGTCNCDHEHKKQPWRVFFTRIREVKQPTKAHPTDAGIDFFVPDAKDWTDEYKSMIRSYSKNPNHQDLVFIGVNGVEVAPGAHVAIPSGIKTIIPTGLAMMMVNKSGVATKLKLDHSACLIDSEYRDELIFCFFNNNQDRVVIEPGMKLTQGLIVPVIDVAVQEVLNCVYDDLGKQTDRGGGFGSSGSH